MKRISFKIKLIVFLEVFVIIINSILGYFIWKELSLMAREASRKKLMSLAATTAYFVDAEKHEQIWTENDQKSKAYKKVQKVLEEMMEANPETDDIYTLRKSPENNRWTYVVEGFATEDIDENGIITEEEIQASVGELFDDSNSPEVFNSTYEPSADRELNCDKWGCFLSGYAPIKDRFGQTVAVAAVDIKAQDVINFEKKTRLIILSVLASLFIFFPIMLYLFLSYIARPVSQIVNGIGIFGNDLSYRLKINTRDEFSLIAESFNNMAGQLQNLYSGLEDKVKEKTQSLQKKVTEIEEKKAKEEALLASIGEGMVATDKNGQIIIANQQAEILFGTRIENMLRKTTDQIYSLLDKNEKEISKNLRPEKIALDEAKKISSSFTCRRLDKKAIPLMVTASPVVFKKKTVGVIIVYRDITKEKEVDKAKSEFVSLASHQLLTPLSNIRWYAEMLSEEEELAKEKQKKYFSKIENSSKKMVELVQALLNVSRIEMGTFNIESKPIDIFEILSGVLEDLEHKIKSKNISIQKKFDKTIGRFDADPKLLRIIFQNLLSNAVKYSKENSLINITLEKNNKEIIMKVSDSGYGIPENQKNRIFTKLFRADNVNSEETEGTGLGLYITKSIVENSGGKIYFQSIENKGTTFFVVFPLSGMKNIKGTRNLI